MDEVLQTVYGGNLAFAAFVGAPNNGDFVVFANGDGADLIVKTPFISFISFG